ncbi:hypothetical protein HGRIS_000814 [Hohenbuehelia grisea]|uniref:F-box domain-containing protein n=1 Tax=Hohenbuehelia grisea TaxID=104357 RepID=A0ABR3IPV5_9AGAR
MAPPFEICEMVFNDLSASDIKTLALVSPDWKDVVQTKLFQKVTLKLDDIPDLDFSADCLSKVDVVVVDASGVGSWPEFPPFRPLPIFPHARYLEITTFSCESWSPQALASIMGLFNSWTCTLAAVKSVCFTNSTLPGLIRLPPNVEEVKFKDVLLSLVPTTVESIPFDSLPKALSRLSIDSYGMRGCNAAKDTEHILRDLTRFTAVVPVGNLTELRLSICASQTTAVAALLDACPLLKDLQLSWGSSGNCTTCNIDSLTGLLPDISQLSQLASIDVQVWCKPRSFISCAQALRGLKFSPSLQKMFVGIPFLGSDGSGEVDLARAMLEVACRETARVTLQISAIHSATFRHWELLQSEPSELSQEYVDGLTRILAADKASAKVPQGAKFGLEVISSSSRDGLGWRVQRTLPCSRTEYLSVIN